MPVLSDPPQSASSRDHGEHRVLSADLGRSTVAVYQSDDGLPFAVVTAEPLRLPADDLFAEADSEFGICLVIRLFGLYPAVGVVRRTDSGFREYWRPMPPASRDSLRTFESAVQNGEEVPVFWRLDDGRYVEFHLGGWNRRHRVWYSRLDGADAEDSKFLLASQYSDKSVFHMPVPFIAN
jgi:hypothetical protein